MVTEVANHLDTKNLHALALTNRFFYRTVNRLLYERSVKHQNSSCLLFAAAKGVIGTAKNAIACGADVNNCRPNPDKPWNRPLHLAAKHGHKDLVEFFIDNGADIDAPFTELHEAKPPVLGPALSGPWGLWLDRWDRWRALHIALYSKQLSTAQLLISRGASLKSDDTQRINCTALHTAAHSGLVPIIELIAKRPNFDANIRDAFGNTALHYASMAKGDRNCT
jgi:ankyrin repeat protein